MGALRTARTVLRPMIDGPLEYRIRRRAGRLIPARDTSGPAHLFHACVWKTASQWVRLILSDPRLLRHSGHQPFIWAHLRDDPRAMAQYCKAPRSLLLTGYGTPERILGLRDTAMRGIFVIRDPRALLASWITSTRYTHRPNAGVLAHRAQMADMNDTDALAYAARAFVAEFGPVLEGWHQTGPETLPVRFEELTGPNRLDIWRGVLAHLGMSVPEQVLIRVLATYRIEALAPSGSGARMARADKYALRGQRPWQTIARARTHVPGLEPIFGWAEQFGYGGTPSHI